MVPVPDAVTVGNGGRTRARAADSGRNPLPDPAVIQRARWSGSAPPGEHRAEAGTGRHVDFHGGDGIERSTRRPRHGVPLPGWSLFRRDEGRGRSSSHRRARAFRTRDRSRAAAVERWPREVPGGRRHRVRTPPGASLGRPSGRPGPESRGPRCAAQPPSAGPRRRWEERLSMFGRQRAWSGGDRSKSAWDLGNRGGTA